MIVNVGDVQLGVDDNGSGMPVVFLHGFPHDRSLWDQQRRALGPTVRCIALDLRGFGDSTMTGTSGTGAVTAESTVARAMTMDRYADDVAALLDVLAIDRAVVCGLSMGGYVATAMWRRHSARIAGLILCDTKGTPDTAEGRAKRDELIALATTKGALAVAERQLPGMVGTTTRERQPEVVAMMRQMMARQSVPAMVGALTAMRERPDSLATLASVTVPTLLLVGEDDVLTPVADARAMLAALPDQARGRLEILSGAGHVSCVERPAAVTHLLADFLGALTDAQT